MAAIVAVVLIMLAAWVVFVPAADWLARHDAGSASGTVLATARDAARGRLLTLCAGILAAGALMFTARNFVLSREGQMTDRYTKAIEQLGSDKLDIRIGAIYALERVARDSARDHPTIMEVLSAFIREHSRETETSPDNLDEDGLPRIEPMRADIQAALSVIARRNTRQDTLPIDLSSANLSLAKLSGVNLADADLRRANLTSATLDEANLTNADLTGATFSGAFLADADLSGALLYRAKLIGVGIDRVKLIGSKLGDADLSWSGLDDADLRGAFLITADLAGVRLSGANLTRADLRGAEMGQARLIGANLTSADLRGAKLIDADFRDANLADVAWNRRFPAPPGWQCTHDGHLEEGQQEKMQSPGSAKSR